MVPLLEIERPALDALKVTIRVRARLAVRVVVVVSR